jgi:hypothetical protein
VRRCVVVTCGEDCKWSGSGITVSAWVVWCVVSVRTVGGGWCVWRLISYLNWQKSGEVFGKIWLALCTTCVRTVIATAKPYFPPLGDAGAAIGALLDRAVSCLFE